MDVKTVCLGMLTDGAASGYDLKKHFESTFAHFFAAGYGSIYPALASLADSGLVTCEEIAQEGKPDRKVYRITDAGRRHLTEALENACPCHKVRSEFLATLCFSHLMTVENVERVLEHRLADIARYESMFRELETSAASDWPTGMQFVLGFGKAMAQAMDTYMRDNRHLLSDSKTDIEAPACKAASGQ